MESLWCRSEDAAHAACLLRKQAAQTQNLPSQHACLEDFEVHATWLLVVKDEEQVLDRWIIYMILASSLHSLDPAFYRLLSPGPLEE